MTAPPDPTTAPPRPAWRRLLRKAWPTIRILVGFGLVVVALWVLSSKDSELSGFTTVLDHLNWWWVPPAFAVEIGSYVAFAAMQWNLLMAGHLRPPWWTLLKLTFGSQALTNSLPIGNAVATVYGFRWFRRFGADNTLAVWALAGTLVAAVVSLSLVAVIGLALATSQGASYDLVPVLIGAFAVAAGHRFALRLRAPAARPALVRPHRLGEVDGPPPRRHPRRGRAGHGLDDRRPSQLDPDRPRRRLGHDQLAARLRLLRHDVQGDRRPDPVDRDCCWPTAPDSWPPPCPSRPAASAWWRAPSPSRSWRSAGSEASTAYAVLLYRLISFWFILVLGWTLIGEMALEVRRGRWNRAALESMVEAGPEAYAPRRRRFRGGGRHRPPAPDASQEKVAP